MFVETLHEARKRTRAGQGKQGLAGITNKMGYYFAIVSQLCSELSDLSDMDDTQRQYPS
jgi:hypothetical protein